MMRAALIATVLLTLAALAYADSTVTYVNSSGKPLYIYYATAPNNVTIDCKSLNSAGTIASGNSWSFTVPGGRWGWVRFQESTEGAGCPSHVNKFDSKVTGYQETRSETVYIN